MKTLLAMALTILAADIVFLLTRSFTLVAITGVIGGFAWAREQRRSA